ncbi:TPA: hypothetical protein N0F65_012290 [Lagenidium giganteum]|uniref:Uncharacterized protein n=1 Tax=Lagenidium giganteum TaxID=4803 RepID=A0AAV2ZIK8_9STRA|nr:TPA: hypothetical protein N0F65_012290 [Lagenidium giganteum]
MGASYLLTSSSRASQLAPLKRN